MAHVVSSDKQRLLALAPLLGMEPAWLQFKPLKDPRTGKRVDAWHWDMVGEKLRRMNALLG